MKYFYILVIILLAMGILECIHHRLHNHGISNEILKLNQHSR